MDHAAARRFLRSVERELAVHRDLLDVMRRESSARIVTAEADPIVCESIRLATRRRRAALEATPGADPSWTLSQTIAALPAGEAARLAELRREFGAVLAALSAESRTHARRHAIAG